MEQLINWCGRCNKYLCSFFLGAMVLIVFINTALRYLFNSSIIQAEELVRYLFIWAVYLSVISVYYEHKHICVTTITDKLSPKALNIFSFGVNILALYGLFILLQGSIMYFMETTNMGQVTKIPYKCAVAPVVIAAFSCGLIVISDLFKQFRQIFGK